MFSVPVKFSRTPAILPDLMDDMPAVQQFLPKQYHGALTDLLRPDLPSSRPQEHERSFVDEPNIVTLAPLPRTQARSSRVESDWDFGFALGVMGKAKRKTRLADYDFKMAESNYTKLEEKKKNHLECFSAKGKFTTVHQLVLKDKIPCTHILRYNKKHLPCKER